MRKIIKITKKSYDEINLLLFKSVAVKINGFEISDKVFTTKLFNFLLISDQQ